MLQFISNCFFPLSILLSGGQGEKDHVQEGEEGEEDALL